MKTMLTGSIDRYFLVVLLFSAPFWLLGAVVNWQAIPGIPASALMVVVPALVAITFVVYSDGIDAALWWINASLCTRAPNSLIWLSVAVLLPPALLAVVYLLMRLGNYPIPAPDSGLLSFVLLIGIFLVPALMEELGWTGFALEKLQRRMPALKASLLIGAIWAIWHLVPLLQLGRPLAWIAWWVVGTVALRVLITWVYNNSGGSVLLAALLHASANASWQSFPVQGSHYDPAIHAIVLVVVTVYVVATRDLQ